jgi:CRP-like cAMP-binding protein
MKGGSGLLRQLRGAMRANAHATTNVRLARWLLMAHDRMGDDRLPLTHEFLSLMLGVRRPGVTEALNALRKRGLISYKRGDITVQDRKGLERHRRRRLWHSRG